MVHVHTSWLLIRLLLWSCRAQMLLKHFFRDQMGEIVQIDVILTSSIRLILHL